MGVSERYVGHDYAANNPDWHVEDSAWKAGHVLRALGLEQPHRICEVGCRAGAILDELQHKLTNSEFVGFDIAPAAIKMAVPRASGRLRFEMADASQSQDFFDLMLIMDVIEHVPDPIDFLASLRSRSKTTMIHIPLDLTAFNALRPKKFGRLRDSVGHIHYFTLETALATVHAAGYRVDDWFFTTTYRTTQPTLLAKLGRIPRELLPDAVAARTLGGYSVLVSATNAG